MSRSLRKEPWENRVLVKSSNLKELTRVIWQELHRGQDELANSEFWPMVGGTVKPWAHIHKALWSTQSSYAGEL